jgi:hypothetical protein
MEANYFHCASCPIYKSDNAIHSSYLSSISLIAKVLNIKIHKKNHHCMKQHAESSINQPGDLEGSGRGTDLQCRESRVQDRPDAARMFSVCFHLPWPPTKTNAGQFKKKVTLSQVYNEVTSEPTITQCASIVRKALKVLVCYLTIHYLCYHSTLDRLSY